MPHSYAPQPPSRVGLFLGGLRHEVLEYSPAGLTLDRMTLSAPGLEALRRGEPCPATLQVFGEMYGVVLRLAGQGPLHVEFAFVSLAAQARGALEHYASKSRLTTTPDATDLPEPMALAFASLAEPVVPEGRRFVVPESEAVYALTLKRKHTSIEDDTPEPAPEVPSASEQVTAETNGIDPRAVFVGGVALFALVALILIWMLA